jgi:hypothetical protein
MNIRLLCLLLIFSPMLAGAYAADVDVYLLSGQSNMVGAAKVSQIEADIPREIPGAFFWNGKDFEPLVIGKTKTSGHDGDFGPEIGFALKMATAKHPIYLIKWAASGMPLYQGWDGDKWAGDEPGPNRKNFYPGEKPGDPNVGTLYEHMIKTFRAGVQHLKGKGDQPVIRGFLWMQGEMDSKGESSAKNYAASLRRLRQRVAEGMSALPQLPMVFGQALPHEPALPRYTHRKELRAQMAAADQDSGQPEALARVKMVSTDGFGLNPDTVHYNADGQMRLGTAMAEAMKVLLLQK